MHPRYMQTNASHALVLLGDLGWLVGAAECLYLGWLAGTMLLNV